MPDAPDQRLLEALLDSWDRNNTIMLNLLRALPEGGLEVKAMPDSPSVAQQFTHINHERLVSVFEEAPEFAIDVPAEEWMVERDRERIAQMLNDSAKAVRDAVKGRVLAGRHGPELRPPAPLAPAPAVARGLPSWPDQAGAQGGGSADQQRRGRAGDVGRLEAEEKVSYSVDAAAEPFTIACFLMKAGSISIPDPGPVGTVTTPSSVFNVEVLHSNGTA